VQCRQARIPRRRDEIPHVSPDQVFFAHGGRLRAPGAFAQRDCADPVALQVFVRHPVRQRGDPGLAYWDYNWRTGAGSSRMIEISKREQFYQREYCGCVYSLRDTNRQRLTSGRERIRIGVQYYGRNEEGDGDAGGSL
jgi:hypothetical protein